MIAHIDRMWMLPPFKKTLEKRQREKPLLSQLDECVQNLFRDATSPGLNLETLNHTGARPILSARINRSHRLILAPLAKTEVGLLYFDNHDEAYHWVDRNRSDLPTMFVKVGEVARGAPLSAVLARVPTVLADEETPLVLASAEQFSRMLAEGITRYLTFLDEEQQRLVDLKSTGLLLVKGGAGTGKTAVALHRVLNLARQPPLLGPGRVLYLCFNNLLANIVLQLLNSLCNGAIPPEIEVKTFHTWCYEFICRSGRPFPKVDEEACEQTVFRAFGRLTPEHRTALGKYDGRFVADEIEQVIKHNGLPNLEAYVNFNRRGRREGLKRPAREAVWAIHQRAQEYQHEQGICRNCDVPLLALDALEASSEPLQYRAVIIDEGQDCSPVMIRLARRLVAEENGSLTVFADPAQAIYDCGFQWTQRELRPAGGNVRWLRSNYRSTQEIFDLARPLLEGHEDLKEDLAQMERPTRHGLRPQLLVATDEAELRSELLERIGRATTSYPPNQIGVLGATWDSLERFASVLTEHGVPAQVFRGRDARIRLDDPTVKLVSIHSAKGWDFPLVFLIGLTPWALGGVREADSPETRRTFYVALTRASEQLMIGAIYDCYHPVLDLLDSDHYDVDGSRGREWGLMHT